ncbi:glycosyltransferase [Paenibacillus doosanensis]|uniref:glycosyltransferase n=1 Tax=Paenibacillus doosanensis TaxID=1229154 RepID=UPI00217F56AA|nr:glycosyltransferase [Paenibacillus doosanensis]MCS7464250.1 glycosyltransferase [Paenibacillus doosanensis]
MSINLSNSRPKVYFFCFNYRKDADIEAIKKEAITYYKIFDEKIEDFQFRFISLESELGENEEDIDNNLNISCWGYKFDELLLKYSPDIIHIFSDSLEGYHLFEANYGERSFLTLYTVTGMNPLPRYEEGYLVHIRHAIDVGNLLVTTKSSIVTKLLSKLGIRTTQIVTKTKMNRNDFVKEKNSKFTVGFASSPMSEDSWEDRGVPLLIELASKHEECHFKIAWRGNVLEKLENQINQYNLSNIEVLNGHIDMYDFYKNVDVVIVPYTSLHNNHSSPLSIVEAISLGIPVIITDVVGIKDIITKYNFGVIAKPDIDDLQMKLNIIITDYEKYKKQVDKLGFNKFYLDNEESHDYVRIYRLLKDQIPVPTLKRWQTQLEQKGNYLVMNRKEIASYYNDERIAELYDEHRFSSYPMRTFDLLERSAINYLIDKYKSNNQNIKLLDIASGDGRVLRELTKYGKVSALENSGFMISVSAKKLDSSSKVTYIKDNFYDFEPDLKFHVVTIFRFIRHYDYLDRKEIYQKLYNFITDDGIILCEFPNKIAETQLRKQVGWENFNVYDVFWYDFEIEDELSENNFEIVDSIPYGEFLLPKEVIRSQNISLATLVCFRKKRG